MLQKSVQLNQKNALIKEEVTNEDIAEIVARWTGIPVTRLLEGEAKKLEKMEEIISRRVVGQKQAIGAIANALRRARAGISEENKPDHEISRLDELFNIINDINKKFYIGKV